MQNIKLIKDINFYQSALFSKMRMAFELIYFERILCVLLKNDAGQLYISHYLFNQNAIEYWYIVPIDYDRLKRLLTGRFPLIKAYSEVPGDFRFLARVKHRNNEELHIDGISSYHNIKSLKNYLPNNKFSFFEDEFSDELEEVMEKTLTVARKNLSEVIDLKLTNRTVSGLPLDNLGDITKTFQRLITDLSSYSTDSTSLGKRGPTNDTIEFNSKMALTELKAGSVKMRFESIAPPELFDGHDIAHLGAVQFSKIIKVKDPKQLCKALKKFSPRIRKNFLSFISSINKIDSGIDISCASYLGKQTFSAKWDKDLVADMTREVSLSTLLNENDIETEGVFIEGNMKTKHFKLFNIDAGRYYSGRFESGREVEQITLSDNRSKKFVLYKVTIHEKESSRPDGTTTYEYTFKDAKEILPKPVHSL